MSFENNSRPPLLNALGNDLAQGRRRLQARRRQHAAIASATVVAVLAGTLLYMQTSGTNTDFENVDTVTDEVNTPDANDSETTDDVSEDAKAEDESDEFGELQVVDDSLPVAEQSEEDSDFSTDDTELEDPEDSTTASSESDEESTEPDSEQKDQSQPSEEQAVASDTTTTTTFPPTTSELTSAESSAGGEVAIDNSRYEVVGGETVDDNRPARFEGDPRDPTRLPQVTTYVSDDRAVFVDWSAPTAPDGEILHYLVVVEHDAKDTATRIKVQPDEHRLPDGSGYRAIFSPSVTGQSIVEVTVVTDVRSWTDVVVVKADVVLPAHSYTWATVNDNTVTVDWLPPNNGVKPEKYSVSISSAPGQGSEHYEVRMFEPDTRQTEFIVDPGEYIVSVVTLNGVGASQPLPVEAIVPNN